MCSHCNQSIAERTYWLHKRHFNDSARDQWLKDDDIAYSDSDDATVDLHSCSDDRGFLLMKSDNAGKREFYIVTYICSPLAITSCTDHGV